PGHAPTIQDLRTQKGLHTPERAPAIGVEVAELLRYALELVIGASNEVDLELCLAGQLSPLYLGTALGIFGVEDVHYVLTQSAPPP
ncbi:peptide chain release factor 3, partial [Pseudoalteromonas sp. S1731]